MLQNTTSTKLQTLHQPHLQLEACLEKIHIKVVDFPNEKTANKMSENAPSIPKGHRHLPALGVLPLRHPNGSTHWIPPETLDATPFLPGGNACRIRDHCWCVCIYICKYANVYIYIIFICFIMYVDIQNAKTCDMFGSVYWSSFGNFLPENKCTFCDPSMMSSCSLLLKANIWHLRTPNPGHASPNQQQSTKNPTQNIPLTKVFFSGPKIFQRKNPLQLNKIQVTKVSVPLGTEIRSTSGGLWSKSCRS